MIIIYYTDKKINNCLKFEHKPTAGKCDKTPLELLLEGDNYIPMKVVSGKLYTYEDSLYRPSLHINSSKDKEVSSGQWSCVYYSTLNKN